jgi:dUTP pyrophosphatase
MEKLVKKVTKRVSKKRKTAEVKIFVKGGEEFRPSFQEDQKFSNCMDLKAFLPKDDLGRDQRIELYPGETIAVPTGVHIELPEGFEAVIRPRSGLALKEGLTVLNSPGTIDTGYRGEIKIIIANLKLKTPNWSGYMENNNKPFVINNGDRIAQLGVRAVPIVKVEYVETLEELSETQRGDKGFGSTGA